MARSISGNGSSGRLAVLLVAVLFVSVSALGGLAIFGQPSTPSATIAAYTAAPHPEPPPVAYFTGDSVVQGYGAERRSDGSFHGFDSQLATYFNWRRINDGRGGTGYVVAGNAEQVAGGNMALSDVRRIDQIVRARPSIVIVASGRNDYGVDRDVLRQAVQFTLDSLKNRLPNAEIYVVGPWLWTAVGSEAKYAKQVHEVDNLIRQEAAARGLVFVNGIDALGSDANSMVVEDGFHPTQDGYDEIASVLRAELIDAGVAP
jgi:lysophospholipase L1-like esterase